MCDAVNHFVHETILPIAHDAVAGVQYAHEKAVEGVEWLDRRIHDLTHSVLPRPVAIIAEAFLKSLPFIAATTLLPLPTFLGVFGISTVYLMITPQKNRLFTEGSFINGIGFANVWAGSRLIGIGYAGIHPIAMALGVLSIACAFWCFEETGLLKNVFENSESFAAV